jgi:hypothetical protein
MGFILALLHTFFFLYFETGAEFKRETAETKQNQVRV